MKLSIVLQIQVPSSCVLLFLSMQPIMFLLCNVFGQYFLIFYGHIKVCLFILIR